MSARWTQAAKPKPVVVQYIRPWLYPKQEHAIFYPRDLDGKKARFSFIEASTKTGKTVGCIAWLAEQAILAQAPHRNYWWVAPVRGQAEIAFTRMKNMYPKGTFLVNSAALKLTVVLTGSVIWFKSGEIPDNLFGEDVWAAVVDEASRMREESWHALRSTLTATRGPVRFIGNVKGRKNWFFALCRKAEAGEPGYSYHKIIAADAVAAKILLQEEIDEAKRDLPEHAYRELYLSEPSDDGANPFGIKYIEQCVRPLSTKPTVAFGIDLAKSVDWSVIIGLDEDGNTSHFQRFQRPWRETLQTIKNTIGFVPTAVDSTGVGDPIAEELQRDIGSHVEGFRFNYQSKQRLMEGLAVDVQRVEVGFPDGVVRKEMESFEYVVGRTGVRYSAPEGFYDDCVCALGLAAYKRRENAGMHLWGKL